MDYDFRSKPYGAQVPMYGPAVPSSSPSSSHPMYGSPMYPRVGQPGHGHGHGGVSPHARATPYHHTLSSSSSSSSGLGIKVTLKPEYRIPPPPQLLPHVGDIPRSNFQFDFSLEKKILAEAEKENQDWSKLGLENLPSRPPEPNPSSAMDPVMSKYITTGLNREAVAVAVANYGDNPTKVHDFANGFALLREMGFSSNSVAEALFMNENDTDKALAQLLHGTS